MAVFKCKMCGGSLEVSEGMTVCECEYCGTKQTLPKTDNEQALNMFNRANHFRQQCEFDKAAEIYERMTAQRDDAELYWSIVLCRYGIEYVDDPLTKKKIPTCHRTQYKSILEDADYLEALSHADSVQKEVYKQEAEYIDKVQKGILEISNKEKPFDVFICYKETDDAGRRTPDSVLAQELYYGLEKEGFKVFFSRITLESKLGTEYEPYIFAALNSAKVMVVVGTKPEYFNAVWVRNEWSRYLMLMQQDRSRTLIPAYKDMDPYDLPDALSMFQAQDMSKLGFMQDLIRGIGKIAKADEPEQKVVKETVVRTSSSNVENLLKRGNLALEDGKWSDAQGFFDQVLNEDVEEHRAYIGFLCAEYKIANEKQLVYIEDDFTQSEYYNKACRFGGEEVKNRLLGYRLQGVYDRTVKLTEDNTTVEKLEQAILAFKGIMNFKDSASKIEECEQRVQKLKYDSAVNSLKGAKNSSECDYAKKQFESFGDYLDSKKMISECDKKSSEIKKNNELNAAKKAYKDIDNRIKGNTQNDIDILNKTIENLEALDGWKDSQELIEKCKAKIVQIEENIKKKEEAEAQAAVEAKRKKKKVTILSAIAVVVVAAVIVFVTVFVPIIKQNAIKKKRESLPNASILATGSDHTVAIRNDGTVVAVGKNEHGECEVSDWKDIIAVSAGNEHIVGLKEDGTVVAAGDNYYMQCDVSEWTDISAISAGYNHTVGLKKDGTAVAVGANSFGQSDVLGWNDIIEVSAGYQHTVGLKKDGTVITVGDNHYEQCNVSDWSGIVAIFAGTYHTVGLKKDGTVVAVGLNDHGQCDVSEWSNIIAISAGRSHTVGIKEDGTVVSVGENTFGQCDLSEWEDIIAVSAGADHTLGLKKDGSLIAVGSNGEGECNVADWSDSISVSAGKFHTVGLKKDGTVIATGSNTESQCDVSEWSDIIAVSAGQNHTVGIKEGGTIVAVGSNKKGQCDVSDWKDITEVSAGDDHTVGLKKDGTVVAAGSNESGQCDVSNWEDIIEVSAGNDHTVGLKKDGTVVAVGSNKEHQCDVSDWKDITAISAGYHYTVGLKKDGTVVCVGSNSYDRCNTSNWKDIMEVSAGGKNTVGLRKDGTVVCAGADIYGFAAVANRSDIVSVSAGYDHIVGLKKDGTVVVAGSNNYYQISLHNIGKIKTD